MKLILLLALGAAALVSSALAPTGERTVPGRGGHSPAAQPVVVELFTSQGCSSCPPADALAEKLAKDRAVLVLSRPVTYWDRLGWKDTLASPANTALQRAYAARGFDKNGVYTPQIVVDGRGGTVGSRESAVRKLVAQAAQADKPMLEIGRKPGGDFAVTVAGASGGTGELVLAALRSRITVGIGSGENGGRKVTYTNVVRHERKLGDWNGGDATFALPAADLKRAGADRYALLLRKPGGGKVLAGRLVP